MLRVQVISVSREFDFLRPLEGDKDALRLGFLIGDAFPNSMSARVFRLDGTKILIETMISKASKGLDVFSRLTLLCHESATVGVVISAHDSPRRCQ
jgi:hypothetical protein